MPALAGGVYQSGLVIVRLRTGSSVVNEVVRGDRLAGELQPPPFPLLGRLGRLFGEQEMVPAERTVPILPGEQAQRGAVQRRLDLLSPAGPVPGQVRVVGLRPALDQDVPDDVGPGEPDDIGAGPGGTEDPAVVPELVAFAEVPADDPVFRLCWGSSRGPLVDRLPKGMGEGGEY